MKVAFVNNQIDNRGTGNALFDYAHYNEELLGNESIIVNLGYGPSNPFMRDKLVKRFKRIYGPWEVDTKSLGIDVVYHIKSGEPQRVLNTPSARYVVHAVFSPMFPHGDRYATISEWMGREYKVPFVPHIVQLDPNYYDWREKYDIPQDARVFARYGGSDSFDIPWVWDAINLSLENTNNYFMFANTDVPDGRNFIDKDRVRFFPEITNPVDKASFIHASNAMLHARARGETFGIAVGEFSIAGKRILTYDRSPERAHIAQNQSVYLYRGPNELLSLLRDKAKLSPVVWKVGYDDFTPEKVMAKFKEVFLDEGD